MAPASAHLRVPETSFVRATVPATEALVKRYSEYRLRQGRQLLDLMPREGVRAVIRACRSTRSKGSIDELAEFCADLIPLPPIGVWLADFQDHREAHFALDGVFESGPRSPDGTPVAVSLRELRHQGHVWVAQLLVSPLSGLWEGALRFHRETAPGSWQTGNVFREESVEAIRDRFLAFDDGTVAAFLRSTLP